MEKRIPVDINNFNNHNDLSFIQNLDDFQHLTNTYYKPATLFYAIIKKLSHQLLYNIGILSTLIFIFLERLVD